MEPVFPLGDDRWLVAAGLCALGIVAIYAPSAWRFLKGRSAPGESVIDYVTACDVANRYIDPDRTMPDGRRIAVRSQILARFEQVGGAMVGEKYNGQLLHRWLQKNAARALVKHQDEIA